MIWTLKASSTAASYILAAALSCAPQQQPAIDLTFTNNAPREINDMSSQDLSQFSLSTKFAHSAKEVFTVGGITAGNTGARFNVTFSTVTDPGTGNVCLWFNKIKVEIVYNPEVYIASEYPPGTCRYDTTLQHEVRHVNTDIITLNEYLPYFKTTLQAAVAAIPAADPVAEADRDKTENMLVEKLKPALKSALGQVGVLRRQRQQIIDTRQEYLRLSKACPPDAPPPR